MKKRDSGNYLPPKARYYTNTLQRNPLSSLHSRSLHPCCTAGQDSEQAKLPCRKAGSTLEEKDKFYLVLENLYLIFTLHAVDKEDRLLIGWKKRLSPVYLTVSNSLTYFHCSRQKKTPHALEEKAELILPLEHFFNLFSLQ